VEQFYKKVDNIDDKVKEANMPYMQWKVLFLVGENTNAEDISSMLEEDLSAIEEILASLESKALIEKADETKSEAEAEVQPEDAATASIGDELLMEEEEVISQVDEQLETPVSEPEEKTTLEEEEVPPLKEDVMPELEEMTPESETKEDFSLEPEEVKEEETFSLDESPAKEESLSSDVDVPEKPELPEESLETEGVTLQEDEFDLSIDEPETTVAEEPEPEVAIEEPEEQKPAEVESADEEIISDSTKKTVMVIDDSIVIRKMIEIALEEENFNIVTAMSGKEGLETIDKENPNLVILDMMLPDMNGIEVLKTIKTDKKLPVIMLSGKDSPQLIETAKEVGVDDFLPKPFRDEELVEKVKTLIEV
jgi:CheY-like chemotaxis protein